MTISRNDAYLNDIKQNYTWQKTFLSTTLSRMTFNRTINCRRIRTLHSAKCYSAECRYAEGRGTVLMY
jgi:hypothetical protein